MATKLVNVMSKAIGRVPAATVTMFGSLGNKGGEEKIASIQVAEIGGLKVTTGKIRVVSKWASLTPLFVR